MPECQSCLQEHEETDELLLMDEDALLMDPEHLPRQLLSDFAVYNSEVSFLSNSSYASAILASLFTLCCGMKTAKSVWCFYPPLGSNRAKMLVKLGWSTGLVRHCARVIKQSGIMNGVQLWHDGI